MHGEFLGYSASASVRESAKAVNRSLIFDVVEYITEWAKGDSRMKTQYVKPVFVKRELLSTITAKPIGSDVVF